MNHSNKNIHLGESCHIGCGPSEIASRLPHVVSYASKHLTNLGKQRNLHGPSSISDLSPMLALRHHLFHNLHPPFSRKRLLNSSHLSFNLPLTTTSCHMARHRVLKTIIVHNRNTHQLNDGSLKTIVAPCLRDFMMYRTRAAPKKVRASFRMRTAAMGNSF